MRAEDVMSSPVVTVHPDTTVKSAAELLAGHGFTALPVVDTEDRLVGILTEADLARDRFAPDPRARLWRSAKRAAEPQSGTVAELMTSPVVAVPRSTDVAELAATMMADRIRSIPIVDGARVVGIVTRRDLLRTLTRNDADIETEVRQVLADYGEHPGLRVRDGVVDIDDRFDRPADRRAAEILARTVPGVQGVHFTRTPEPAS